MKHTSWLSGLSAVDSPRSGGGGPHVGLREIADREADAGQHVLVEHVEHVGLVLGGVGAAGDTP